MNSIRPVAVAALFAATLPLSLGAHAANDPELQTLRAEIAALKQAYETRIAALEQRLLQAESPPVPVSTVPAPAASAGTGFNPDLSLILQGAYRDAKGDGHITGFLPAGHDHARDKGFSLDKSEVVLSASIDPYFRGYANFAVTDGEVETEEAWMQSTMLGHGFGLKAGRFLSGIGYANEQHAHAWDFADQNLAYRAMLGEHYGQDGVQLKWLAPTPLFLEFGIEAAQGANWGDRNQPGSHALFAHVGDDIGESHSWRAGLSYLRTKSNGREGHWDDSAGEEAETRFDGESKYLIADLVWKWAPEGNPMQRNFKFQAEYLHRKEDGHLTCLDNSAAGGACPVGDLADAYNARQSGWYAQGVYQFMPRWRVGYRHDRLDIGAASFGAGFAGVLSKPDFRPKRDSLMLDWNPSEFSRLRLQFARDQAEQGLRDKQVTLQYLHSLGAHGAHRF